MEKGSRDENLVSRAGKMSSRLPSRIFIASLATPYATTQTENAIVCTFEIKEREVSYGENIGVVALS